MGKFTYEDYCLLPDDGKIHEIINGEHYNHTAPVVKHQSVAAALDFLILPYVRRRKLGYWYSAPLDVLLGRYDTVQPDRIFILKGNERIITEPNIKGAPDLLIEIISGDPAHDKSRKFKLYERRAVNHYWIVDPMEEALFAYRLKGGKYRLLGEFRKGNIFRPVLFPRLKIEFSGLFARF
jgi:Uma2 family endonuclease